MNQQQLIGCELVVYMKLKIDNIRSTFEGEDVPVDLIDGLCSVYRTNFQFMPLYNKILSNGKRAWDGKIHHFRAMNRTVPTGLVPQLLRSLRESQQSVEIEFVERAKVLPLKVPLEEVFRSMPVVPWEHQKTCCTKFVKSGGRGIIRAATGAGKTLIAAMLIKGYGVRSILIVKGKALVTQTREELARFLQHPVGMIMASTYEEADVIVTSVDTLAKRIKDKNIKRLLASYEMVIADEVQLVGGGAQTFQKVLDLCVSARTRCGMSGTPIVDKKDDDLALISRIGPLVVDISPSSLQKQGILAKGKLVVTEITTPTGGADLSYQEALQELIYKNTDRTQLIIEQVIQSLREKKNVLLIAGNSVAYVRALRSMYMYYAHTYGLKYAFEFVTGQDKKDVAFDAVKKARAGQLPLLCTTVLFDMGIDIPVLDDIYFAAPSKSYPRVMQRLGRVLRNLSKNKTFRVFDYQDLTNDYLTRHFKARMRIYKDEDIFEAMEKHLPDKDFPQLPLFDELEDDPLEDEEGPF